MGRIDCIRELEAMGLRVEGDATGLTLSCDNQEMRLGAAPDWNALPRQAQSWINELVDHAGATGAELARRRRAMGFENLSEFCDFACLNETQVFDAEAGMATPRRVHLRILDWLEDGRLKA